MLETGVEGSLSLSMLVLASASSAVAAKELMKASGDDVGMERFRVRFNLAFDSTSTSDTDVLFRLPSFFGIGGGSIRHHDSFNIADHMGFGMDFTFKDSGILVAEAFQGKSIADGASGVEIDKTSIGTGKSSSGTGGTGGASTGARKR